MKRNIKVLLIAIIALGFLLRIAGIGLVPPSLNWDEVSHGYNAYSILKTGRDEWGMRMPIIFRAYGDYKLPVYIYLTALSELIFGLNILAVRLVSIMSGVATILFTFLLTRRLLKGQKSGELVALMAAFLVAIEPWDLFLSRIALEANLALALIVTGVFFLIKGVEEKTKWLVFGITLLGLSCWTYNSARVFVPLFLVVLVGIYVKEFGELWRTKKQLMGLFFIVGFALLAPMFGQLLMSSGQARYSEVRIVDQGAINRILETRNNLGYGPLVNRLISNKYTYFGVVFGLNYLKHFDFQFLFLNGGSDYQFNVPSKGLIYLINIPFFYGGILLLVTKFKKEKFAKLVIIWLILSPIASSITRESPHTLRAIVMLPIPMIISAYTFVWLLEKVKSIQLRILIGGIYLLILFLFLENYLMVYVNDYRTNYSWSWQYGYKEVATYINKNYDKYDKILITKKYGEPHEFLLFYGAAEGISLYGPEEYRNSSNLIRFNQSNWWWVDRFDKFYFVNDWQVQDMVLESGGEINCKEIKCLLITSENNKLNDFTKIGQIDFLDRKVAFEIYEN